VAERRYQAVLAVIGEGGMVSEAAARWGVPPVGACVAGLGCAFADCKLRLRYRGSASCRRYSSGEHTGTLLSKAIPLIGFPIGLGVFQKLSVVA